MALNAGIMTVTVEYGKDLKDCDWFGKQDPYVIVKCAGQTFRSRTATDGGRNPVWNETFHFNVINENSIEFRLMDEDTLTRDDVIGDCAVSLAKVREQGRDTVQVPVLSPHRKRQRGFMSVKLAFTSNQALKPQQQQQAPQHAPLQQQLPQHLAVAPPLQPLAPAPVTVPYAPQPMVYAPQPYPYAMYPHQAYAAAPPMMMAFPQQQQQQQQASAAMPDSAPPQPIPAAH